MPVAQCDGLLVQQAFALGWHVAELYHFDQQRHDSIASDALSLPGIGDLSETDRKGILTRQIAHDLKVVWSEAAIPPEAPELEKAIAAAGALTVPGALKEAILEIHTDLLSGLTVANFRLGKAYGLGRALAETSILPIAAAQGRIPTKGDGIDELGSAFLSELLRQFRGGRVDTVQGWLHDLRDCFPLYAADAVATTMGGWSVWLVRPTIGAELANWQDGQVRGRIERTLRRQGDVWRGLLSGEKDPLNMLTSEDYFGAIRSLLAKITRLAVRFLASTIGLLLGLAAVVAAIFLYFALSSGNGSATVAAAIALLGSLGITTGSAWAAVQKALTNAEEPLWKAELSAAVSGAAWHNPAPLGSIEEIQLLLTVGSVSDEAAEMKARHPQLSVLRNLPVGRLGIILIIASTAIGIFGASHGRIERDAAYFLPALCIVAFLAAIDGWDLLIGFAARQTAPYLALPDRISLPTWAAPLAEVLAPVLLIVGLLAGHYFWH